MGSLLLYRVKIFNSAQSKEILPSRIKNLNSAQSKILKAVMCFSLFLVFSLSIHQCICHFWIRSFCSNSLRLFVMVGLLRLLSFDNSSIERKKKSSFLPANLCSSRFRTVYSHLAEVDIFELARLSKAGFEISKKLLSKYFMMSLTHQNKHGRGQIVRVSIPI